GKDIITLAGRVMSIRGQGGLTFCDLFDGSGREAQAGTMQLLLKKDEMNEQVYTLFADAVDIGDIIEATGVAYTTKRGEQALFVQSWTMLTKSLLPLPEKWHGLSDDDERYRKRYLDILINPNVRELFEKKAKFWQVTRRFLEELGFLEVETPTLELTTGGAEATPFAAHHKDFDLDVYLRISVGELWQKRLMAAGFPRTFEIGRVYRNEGSSPEHIQEFTNMECYAAYMPFSEGKSLVQQLYRTLANEVFGTSIFTTRGHVFDLEKEWIEIDYADEIKKQTGVDIFAASIEEITARLNELGVKYEGTNLERLTDTLWKYCRKHISGPAFLVNHPLLVAPLSKTLASDVRKTEMFQVILAGSEMGRAHAELNDPIEQARRFAVQQELLKAGDEEAMMADNDFVEMLEHGMPPTFGFGFGERLFTFMADKPIRETQLFPLVKPRTQ
ncbi:MAG TPA: amino acid--tRNA ligase-related protein, partial [Candidatus Paceibacterota bacterium]|nr:amino acid--tRNA ligase-related protein [Candidatus Paceibacterota bacterium]